MSSKTKTSKTDMDRPWTDRPRSGQNVDRLDRPRTGQAEDGLGGAPSCRHGSRQAVDGLDRPRTGQNETGADHETQKQSPDYQEVIDKKKKKKKKKTIAELAKRNSS